jgi:hypothetical protein
MTRILALLSSAAVLAAGANAQCPQGADAGLVKWSSTSSYASTFDADDEGISNPPIALGFNFPMPGAVGNLDQAWIGANGEIYLADSTAGLTEPTGAALFGANSLSEFQGPAGGLARVVCLGGDHESADVAGANWSCTADTSVAGQLTVTWVDVARFANVTDKFSFQAVLFSSGVVQFNYGNTFPVGLTGRWIGISVGNAEPSTGGSQVFTTLPTSPLTEGILYETVANFDTYNGQSVLIAPDFTVGNENYSVVSVTPYVPPPCASNVAYGTGCHSFVGPNTNSNLFQLFPDHASAKAALDGNAVIWTRTANGYTANYAAGAAAGLYVAPTGGATIVANGDDTTTTFAPSAAIPVPGGLAASWTISSNGVLTAAATGNQGTSFSPSLSSTATQTGLAFYVWGDHNPNEAGSGKVKTEEAAGVLYVTFDAVEAYGTPTVAPGTFQWQINMTTGDVTQVFLSMSASTSTGDILVGCTLAGAGPTPVSSTLSTVTPYTLFPPVSLSPMTLSASPAPKINPSTNVTYVAGNLPEFIPGSGVYLSTMFLSVNPNPAGFDLNGILTTVPGCNAWIVTLDLDLGAQLTFAPTASWNFTYDNVNFAPGNAIAAQAVSLFDTAFPLANGEAGGFLFSNGVLSTTELQ